MNTSLVELRVAAARFGVSRQWVHVLLARYREGGLDDVEPRSHRPHSNPRQTPTELAERMVALRCELTGQGLDAGPLTIAARRRGEGRPVPSTRLFGGCCKRPSWSWWASCAEDRFRCSRGIDGSERYRLGPDMAWV